MGKLVKRSKKLTFMDTGLLEAEDFQRMIGFTNLATSRNPKEYTRQYVDNDFETTDVVAISTSTEFAFDQFAGNKVHDKLVEIIESELIGDEAIVTLLNVDLSAEPFVAVKRDFVVIAGSQGDSMDAYTYGGTFKVKGEPIIGTATTTDKWKTATFTANPE